MSWSRSIDVEQDVVREDVARLVGELGERGIVMPQVTAQG